MCILIPLTNVLEEEVQNGLKGQKHIQGNKWIRKTGNGFVCFVAVFSSTIFWDGGNVLVSALSNHIAATHMWLLSNLNVASVTDLLTFNLYSILISLEIQRAPCD